MTLDTFIRLVVPDLGPEELREVEEVFASGQLTQGPKVAAFERVVADRVAAAHGIATTSATTALHLSLAALGIGPRDEVLVADYTFPASANVVVQQGARPVLVDIDPSTFTIDPKDLATKVTHKTRAIMPVHTFGLSADMDPIMAIAEEHGLLVVEDAACAIGTTYYGRPVGSIGTLGCFSFHPRKAITTGEGGMVTTNDPAIADTLRLLRNHGGHRADGRFTFAMAGFNYRLSDILAAIGLAQMRKLEAVIAEKRRLAGAYRSALAGVPGVTPPVEPAWGGHVYQSFVILLDSTIERDLVIARMRERGIETTLGTYALHNEPFFRNTYGGQSGDLPGSWTAYRQSLTLPLYPGLGDNGVGRVVESLRAVLTWA